MRSEQVEVLRRLVDGIQRRDFDAVREVAHPEGEFTSALLRVEGGVYRFDDIERYVSDLYSMWQYWELRDLRFIDAGDDVVVVVFRAEAKGKSSGVPVEHRIAQVWQLRDGKAYRGVAYMDVDEAMRAAGLPDRA